MKVSISGNLYERGNISDVRSPNRREGYTYNNNPTHLHVLMKIAALCGTDKTNPVIGGARKAFSPANDLCLGSKRQYAVNSSAPVVGA